MFWTDGVENIDIPEIPMVEFMGFLPILFFESRVL